MKGLEKMDRQLQRILNAYDSWRDAAEKAVWVVMGDGGQTAIGRDKDKAAIRLHSLFKGYRIAKINEVPDRSDQLLFAVNDRMAYIYVTDRNMPLQDAINELKKTNESLLQRGKKRLDICRFEAFFKTAAVSSKRRLSRSLRAVMDDQRRFFFIGH